MPTRHFRPTAWVCVLAAVTLLVACARDESLQNAPQSQPGTPAAPSAASRAAADLAITAEIKSRLARDRQLGALDIHVETKEGRVVLRGSAPDTDARGQAARLSHGVVGVVGIQNDVSVQVLTK